MKKYDNFCTAFRNLKDVFSYEEPYNNVVLTGLVALYEICFEQSWKLMKELLEENGVAEAKTGSPRQILKSAYQAGLFWRKICGWKPWQREIMWPMRIIRRLPLIL